MANAPRPGKTYAQYVISGAVEAATKLVARLSDDELTEGRIDGVVNRIAREIEPAQYGYVPDATHKRIDPDDPVAGIRVFFELTTQDSEAEIAEFIAWRPSSHVTEPQIVIQPPYLVFEMPNPANATGVIEDVKANIHCRNRDIERHRDDLRGHVMNVVGSEIQRRAHAKDERKRAEAAIEALDLPERGQEEREEPPSDERGGGDASVSSATAARDTSVEIQLASIDVVEQLTHRVEEVSPHEYEKDMARATREFLHVLRQYAAGEVPEGAARSVLESLRAIGNWCVSHTASAVMGGLGMQLLKLVAGYNIP